MDCDVVDVSGNIFYLINLGWNGYFGCLGYCW